MLSDLLNQIWASGKWRQDARVLRLLEHKWQWPYDSALVAVQLESRIADKFFTLTAKQREEVIIVTAALIADAEIPDPISGVYVKAK